MSLWKCSQCGFIIEGETAPVECPKCGAPQEKFEKLDEEAAKKVYDSDRTNDIHSEIINLCAAIVDLAHEGVEIGLDPGCIRDFNKAIDDAWVIKQRSKAELAIHVGKGKW